MLDNAYGKDSGAFMIATMRRMGQFKSVMHHQCTDQLEFVTALELQYTYRTICLVISTNI